MVASLFVLVLMMMIEVDGLWWWVDCIHPMPKSCVGVTIVVSKILENVVAIGTVPFAFRCLVGSREKDSLGASVYCWICFLYINNRN